ncbi:hypothetical protein ACWEVY_06825 [Streptomyces longwoodensis]
MRTAISEGVGAVGVAAVGGEALDRTKPTCTLACHEAKLAHLKAESHPDAAAIEAQERTVEIDRRVLGAAEVEVTGFEELVHALCDDLP